jgi:hypothetical protein
MLILKTILRVAVVVERSKAGLEMVKDLWIISLAPELQSKNKLLYMTFELLMNTYLSSRLALIAVMTT